MDIIIFFFSFEVLGKDIEFGKPALYIETSSEDLVLVSMYNIFIIYFQIIYTIETSVFKKKF